MRFSSATPSVARYTILAILWMLMVTGLAEARPADWVIRDGALFVKGEWVFLKIAKPLRRFASAQAVDQLISELDILQQKHFNCIEINCYWEPFDHDGDGRLDVSTEPLRKLVDAIYARGMFPCISVETYGVGGGQIPKPFLDAHPDAVAVDSKGRRVKDDEYGGLTTVPSIFYPPYLEASREYIRNIARAVDFSKVLYFETTVEPQYIGKYALDYSAPAKAAYENWRAEKHPDAPGWPEQFPALADFVSNPLWNQFRAEALADWVNRDAAAYRDIAGADAYIAVDYLETCGPEMRNRNGDSLTFLRNLDSANIIQVNWTWNGAKHKPNDCAYRNVRAIMAETQRDWVITEHMTINGTDYAPADMENLLRNTIRNSTHFGWEFVDVAPRGDFSVYGKDWQPKPSMRVVDDRWDEWMKEIRKAHRTK